MPGLNKKELTSKPLRMDARMAKDLERLSKYTGYSQNDIIVLAIRRYLFENREYFLRDMVDEMCINRIEREVRVMHSETHLAYGGMSVDIVKADVEENQEQSIYTATVILRNNMGDVFYQDRRNVDMNGQEWDSYKEFLYDIVLQYKDIEEPALRTYFREKFLYE